MKLVWSDPAVSDLEAIRDYIAHDSDHYAAQFVDVREVLFQSYRIIYRVESQRILILAIVHGSRNLGGMRTKPWGVG
ncbi:MAG: type II toxin-antitoxin system RelE/ParE family toxin [bacterium]|nr:type II toxin-antitoxin system RelE/ParE family toxin [bacterium]